MLENMDFLCSMTPFLLYTCVYLYYLFYSNKYARATPFAFLALLWTRLNEEK
mgnify:CR=1 FL=1